MNKPFYRRLLPYKQFNATFYLIGINVLVFILYRIIPSINNLLALNLQSFFVERNYWQVFTYMFAHADLTHILFNMLGLFIFGHQIEKNLGSYEFLFFYLLVGTLVGVVGVPFNLAIGSIGFLGASGAVYGVLLAFATFYPSARLYIYGLIPVRASHLVIGFTVWGVFNQLIEFTLPVRSGISHFGHLMGFAFAYLYFLVRIGVNPINRFFPPKENRY